MKFCTFKLTVLLASFSSMAIAFSAVAPPSSSSTTPTASTNGIPNNFESVDKTMDDIDEDTSACDPMAGGDFAAVKRNNYNEAWVAQVSKCIM